MPADRTAPTELELELLRLWENDVSMERLGAEHNISRQAVSQKIRKAYAYVHGQVPPRLERRPSDDAERKKQAAIAMYRDGIPRQDILRRLRMGPKTLNAIVTEAGLPARICRRCKQAAPVTSPLCAACKGRRNPDGVTDNPTAHALLNPVEG